jgi:hypothetical protein
MNDSAHFQVAKGEAKVIEAEHLKGQAGAVAGSHHTPGTAGRPL